MAGEIPESVYLNAAKNALVARAPALTADEAVRLAPLVSGSPEHRAAVESVWAARGRHDAAAIERVRALAERAEGLGEIVHPSDLLAALDLIEPSADPCPQCGPGYRYGDEGCRHIPPRDIDAEDRIMRVLAAKLRETAESPALVTEFLTHFKLWPQASPAEVLAAMGRLVLVGVGELDEVCGNSTCPCAWREPATDMATKRPCTIYVPPEYCSDPHRCRVHRGACPADQTPAARSRIKPRAAC